MPSLLFDEAILSELSIDGLFDRTEWAHELRPGGIDSESMSVTNPYL